MHIGGMPWWCIKTNPLIYKYEHLLYLQTCTHKKLEAPERDNSCSLAIYFAGARVLNGRNVFIKFREPKQLCCGAKMNKNKKIPPNNRVLHFWNSCAVKSPPLHSRTINSKKIYSQGPPALRLRKIFSIPTVMYKAESTHKYDIHMCGQR